LTERYLMRGDSVCTIDDLSTGSIENIRPFKDHPRYRYHIDSVQNVPLTAELVDEADVVIHLAAAVGVRLIVESPVRTIETNIQGTEVVLSLAAKKRRRVLIASTSEVYGKRVEVPFREDDDLVMGPTSKGRWSYACSKAIDEFLALAYWKEKRVPTTIVRLFNTVGPRQTGRYGMVVPTMVRQALREEPITVYGDGTQSRCFGHVSDVVGALVALAEHDKAVGEVFNVGNDGEITIGELAHRIKRMTSSPSPIEYIPYEQAYEAGFEDMLRRVPDLTKLKSLIDYRPQYDTDRILESVIAYEVEKMTRRHVPALQFGAHV
jgi:UDP-glucose 4-epimerase